MSVITSCECSHCRTETLQYVTIHNFVLFCSLGTICDHMTDITVGDDVDDTAISF